MKKQLFDLQSTVVAPTFGSQAAQTEHRQSLSYKSLKRVFDVLVVILTLLLLSPLFLIAMLSLWILQGRPIFIRHRRVGLGGRSFFCLKLRTMVNDGDEMLRHHLDENKHARMEWEANCKLKDDPRITPLGSVLRKSSVDELPQLINILRGDMSLVGPRPIIEEELDHYGAHISHYYRVRPGLTGLWQISGRSDVSYPYRVKLDVAYVERMSFMTDLLILMKTVPAVLKLKGSY
jgi:exopolysaccharide production protein ExoY